ncbi:MAG: CBS domain-containing protein, partial [Desulfobacterales bacterium]|nr:CBS domain-containing protein [Desulfobacterales bacterium]
MKTVLIADVSATSGMQALVVEGDMPLADAVRQFATNHDLRGIFLAGENGLLTGVINKIDLLNWVSMQQDQLPAGEPLNRGQMRRLLNAKRVADLAAVGSEQAAVRLDETI